MCFFHVESKQPVPKVSYILSILSEVLPYISLPESTPSNLSLFKVIIHRHHPRHVRWLLLLRNRHKQFHRQLMRKCPNLSIPFHVIIQFMRNLSHNIAAQRTPRACSSLNNSERLLPGRPTRAFRGSNKLPQHRVPEVHIKSLVAEDVGAR